MEATIGTLLPVDTTQMRQAEVRNLRSVKWCTSALSLNDKISPVEAKRGSLNICGMGEYLVDVEFAVLWGGLFPKGEKTTQTELVTAPFKLQKIAIMIKGDRAIPPDHTTPFLNGINNMRGVAKEVCRIRESDSYVGAMNYVKELWNWTAFRSSTGSRRSGCGIDLRV